MSSGAAAAPSLIARVLRRVLLPLGLTWLLGTAVALVVASYFAEQAFDRAMLDDAYSVSANVRAGERGVELLLSPREMNNLLFDQAETVYFAVLRPDGSLLAGDAGLRAPAPQDGARHRFSRIDYQGQALRAVVLNQEEPLAYRVVIAQTTRGRASLVEKLLAYSLAPQLVLLALLAAWIWRGIDRELHPLGDLRRTLERRDAHDLAPVPVARSSRELEQLGDTLNALFERLARSASAQREFAGNVAHELRTPLAGIRALADYGLAQRDPAAWREQLQQILASQVRASHLVDQLLALALADEGHTRLQREPLRLDQLGQQAVLRHLARSDAQGVDLGGLGLEEAVTVAANAALVEGILDNLIDNALRYGGHTITVELSGRTLSVVDDGPGIAPDAQPDLLQRWAQGPAGQKLGQGAGLGLAIVARYAKLLGAELSFARASDEGGLRVSVAFSADAQAAVQARAG
ncbi:sensor histidine kinase [Variovorax ginsengisoli]|uniref:histidine kinase n=1 Tax=Variovorax ginsengisoli TaxID=363844 RepID=A0ABT8RXM9_9BURK|nr:sensor histidine kinase [Variovorax ginsengisoli]MDN8612231.1 sensor histidine kinase N-terminal domain-containing protein [Variovorax ginsengisoli]MDO1531401.1 sensor histidine kinase N-terminal domain-containing protein [Variovorax ginsengisoli]